MPLKHDTETRLTILLGVMIALAGVVCAFLPPVSVSVWPWVIAFALSLAYPLLLYPLLRSRRADNFFRLLHFFPALMLLLWLVLELLAAAFPSLQILQTVYTLGWSAGGVIVGFLLLTAFSLRVIRQRTRRIPLLLSLLTLFLVVGAVSDAAEWDRRFVASLWNGDRFALLRPGTTGNLLPSSDPLEEQWRVELRLMEQRRLALLRGDTGGLLAFPVEAPARGVQMARLDPGLSSGTGEVIPPRLPGSGFGMEGVAMVFLALTSAAVHRRTIRRRNDRTA